MIRVEKFRDAVQGRIDEIREQIGLLEADLIRFNQRFEDREADRKITQIERKLLVSVEALQHAHALMIKAEG